MNQKVLNYYKIKKIYKRESMVETYKNDFKLSESKIYKCESNDLKIKIWITQREKRKEKREKRKEKREKRKEKRAKRK